MREFELCSLDEMKGKIILIILAVVNTYIYMHGMHIGSALHIQW